MLRYYRVNHRSITFPCRLCSALAVHFTSHNDLNREDNSHFRSPTDRPVNPKGGKPPHPEGKQKGGETMKESYQSDLQKPVSYRSSINYQGKLPEYRFAKQYKPSWQGFPSITDELRGTVEILANCLKIKENYIKELRKSRDSLISKIDIKEIHIEDLQRRIKRYQECFYKEKEKEQEKAEITEKPH